MPQPLHRWRIARILAITILAIAAAGCQRLPHIGIFTHHVAGPSLNGTYRLIYDSSQATVNGLPNRVESDKVLWAFRSACTDSGCVATATALDRNNSDSAYTPSFTTVLHFDNGQWKGTPTNVPVINKGPCLGPGDTVVEQKAVTTAEALNLKPQSDGTLSGTLTATALSNECGHQGQFAEIPLVATRTGDVSPSVTVADPDSVDKTASPDATSSQFFNGVYTLQADTQRRTRNGLPAPISPTPEQQWAMRSVCSSPTHCIATGALIGPPYAPDAVVLESAGTKWQSASPRISMAPCLFSPIATTMLAEWEIDPQTGIGTETDRVLTGQCGDMGAVYAVPITLQMTGAFPATAVVADPALFLR